MTATLVALLCEGASAVAEDRLTRCYSFCDGGCVRLMVGLFSRRIRARGGGHRCILKLVDGRLDIHDSYVRYHARLVSPPTRRIILETSLNGLLNCLDT